MKMWLTRDDVDGERALWTSVPWRCKEGFWFGVQFISFIAEDEIDVLVGKECFGVPKGGIAEVDVKLEMAAL